jgi:hypothetical protein
MFNNECLAGNSHMEQRNALRWLGHVSMQQAVLCLLVSIMLAIQVDAQNPGESLLVTILPSNT